MLYLLTYLKSAGGVYKILGAEKNQAETVCVKGKKTSLKHLNGIFIKKFVFDRRRSNHMSEVADATGRGQCANQSTGILCQRVQRPCLHRDQGGIQKMALVYKQHIFKSPTRGSGVRKLLGPKVLVIGSKCR